MTEVRTLNCLTCDEEGRSHCCIVCRAGCWSGSRTPWGRCTSGSGRWRTSEWRGRFVAPAGSEHGRIYVGQVLGSKTLVVFIMKLLRSTVRLGEVSGIWSLKFEAPTGFIRGERSFLFLNEIKWKDHYFSDMNVSIFKESFHNGCRKKIEKLFLKMKKNAFEFLFWN